MQRPSLALSVLLTGLGCLLAAGKATGQALTHDWPSRAVVPFVDEDPYLPGPVAAAHGWKPTPWIDYQVSQVRPPVLEPGSPIRWCECPLACEYAAEYAYEYAASGARSPNSPAPGTDSGPTESCSELAAAPAAGDAGYWPEYDYAYDADYGYVPRQQAYPYDDTLPEDVTDSDDTEVAQDSQGMPFNQIPKEFLSRFPFLFPPGVASFQPPASEAHEDSDTPPSHLPPALVREDAVSSWSSGACCPLETAYCDWYRDLDWTPGGYLVAPAEPVAAQFEMPPAPADRVSKPHDRHAAVTDSLATLVAEAKRSWTVCRNEYSWLVDDMHCRLYSMSDQWQAWVCESGVEHYYYATRDALRDRLIRAPQPTPAAAPVADRVVRPADWQRQTWMGVAQLLEKAGQALQTTSERMVRIAEAESLPRR